MEAFLNGVFRRRQQAFAAVLFPAFLEGKIALLCSGEHITSEDRFFPFTVSPFRSSFWSNTHTDDYSDFQAEAAASERNLLVLFEAGVIPLRPSASCPFISTTLTLISGHLGDDRRRH
jgi:hypothetical protein